MDTQLSSPDPKNLVITTPGRQYNTPEPDGTVVFLGAHNFLDQSVEQIRSYTQEFGTLKTLTVVGHGDSDYISAQHHETDKIAGFNVSDFLNRLKQIQKETGTKIADRIVFDACLTMSHLSPEQQQVLKKTAKELGAEIVGETISGDYNPHTNDKTPIVDKSETSLFVAFKPDGTVRRDRLSTNIYDRIKVMASAVDDVSKNDSFLTRITAGSLVKGFIAGEKLLKGDEKLTSMKADEKIESSWVSCGDVKDSVCQVNENNEDNLPKARANSRDTKPIKGAAESSEMPAATNDAAAPPPKNAASPAPAAHL